MTPLAAFSFFAIMLALAAIPSASVALVIARSASHGIRNGAAVATGIVLGDLLFIAIALLGMSALALTMGSIFAVFKYIGGAYLIWLGVQLLRAKGSVDLQETDLRPSSLFTSFAAGFFLTLGDLKAILFYASLFPTLIDVQRLSPADIAAIVLVTIVAVGGVKLAYAVAARSIVARLRTQKASRKTQKVAGVLMIGTGACIIVKT